MSMPLSFKTKRTSSLPARLMFFTLSVREITAQIFLQSWGAASDSVLTIHASLDGMIQLIKDDAWGTLFPRD